MPTTEILAGLSSGPGMFRRPGQSKEAFKLIIDGATTTTLLAEPVPVVQSLLPAAAVAGTSGYHATGNFTCARLVFAGTATAGNTVHYQVVLWYPGPVVSGVDELTFVPIIVSKGTVEFGSTTYTTNDMGATGNLFADTIVDERGHGGVVVNSPGDNSKAWIDVDLHNASGIEVEVDRDTATTVDVMMQLGEVPMSAVAAGGVALPGPTAPEEMFLWLDAGVGNQTLADPIPIHTLPTMSVGTGKLSVTTGAIFTRGKRHACFTFGGVGGGGTINYQVVGWRQIQTVAGTTLCYFPEKIAAGVATLGTATYHANEFGAGTELLCDAMTETTNHMRAYVQPAIDNEVCFLHLDVTNFLAIEIEGDIAATATAYDIIGQLGDLPAPFDSVSVVGHKDDTETSSLHGKIGTDTEMGDASLYDMLTGYALGAIDDAVTSTLHGKIGTDSEMGDKSIFDLILRSSGWEWVENLAKSVVRAAGATTLFTVTGRVEVRLLIIGETEVTAGGACDCSVGISGDTGIFVAAVDLDVNTIAAGEIWHDATPDKTYELASTAWTSVYMLAAGQDIIFTNAAEVTAGALDCYAVWHRIGSTGNVVAA